MLFIFYNMTKIEVTKGNKKIIMVDGYVPPYEYFMTNRKTLKKKGPLIWDVLYRYSPKCKLNENKLLLFFDALLRAYRIDCCYAGYHLFNKKRQYNCSEFTFTTKQNWHSIENTVYRRSFSEYLPSLKKEFRKQELEGFINYTQNIVIYYPICKFWQKCAFGWINYFGFHIKKYNEYKDYHSFRKSWRKILRN